MDHSLALTARQEAYGWGSNQYGQIGISLSEYGG